MSRVGKQLGIRLHNLELYNWGTFDQAIWQFEPKGETALLTGESGSGKSTVVDALSTLLVPPRKLAYNKAADSSAKERSIKSYVLGYYGRKYAMEGKGTPEKLRDERQYSVLLASFKDEEADVTTSLALFFWFKDNDADPSRLYVVSDEELFIREDFSGFESDLKLLRLRLKQKGAKVFDNYNAYAECFRRKLGGLSEQAIELFVQTISMKKVEALNGFVRESMLEKEDIERDIDELLSHYANLNSAYEAVVKAKTQIEKLTPICEKGRNHNNKEAEQRNIKRAIDAVPTWFASKNRPLLLAQIEEGERLASQISHKIDIELERQEEIKREIFKITHLIHQNGGDEREILQQELEHAKVERGKKWSALQRYNQAASALGLKQGNSLQNYLDNQEESKANAQKLEQQYLKSQEMLEKIAALALQKEQEISEITAELQSLRTRTSNIPSHLVQLRAELCRNLGVEERALPFAGELLEVKESQAAWEGAIERLAHSFAVSLLVSGDRYTEVSQWVNKKHLGTRLVYFRVGHDGRLHSYDFPEKDTVADKLSVQEDSPFSNWLRREIAQRFPHTCCDTVEAFRNHYRAITRSGLIKSGQRNEKDDCHTIDNRANYVLGFSNLKKCEALEHEILVRKNELKPLYSSRDHYRKEQAQAQTLLFEIKWLMEHEGFVSIDVESEDKRIAEREARIAKLGESSGALVALEEQKKQKEAEQRSSEARWKEWYENKTKAISRIELLKFHLSEMDEVLELEQDVHRESYPFLEDDFPKFLEKWALENPKLRVPRDYNDKNRASYLGNLNNRSSGLLGVMSQLRTAAEKLMSDFKRTYPLETMEMTDEMESLSDYDRMLEQLQYHNLPKYQADFKSELQGKITRHISLFHVKLQENGRNIVRRIAEINESLKSIPYNAGRYITLNCEDTVESDIRDFKFQLKSCTEGMTTLDDEWMEKKFIQIKEIIERFKGRPQLVEADRRWKTKVTDVRNWFVFSATERYFEDDREYEHYSDSDGKSGGQKEKLAYTILAASLAYNYRLNRPETAGSSFRLVVIDEAFLKSSDESAKFGLSLFHTMRFQLLVVTPLLKISTIEPFISHVGFVSHNEVTHQSQMRNVTIEEYRETRKRWEENGFAKVVE